MKLEQYTRRYSVVVKGIERDRNENFENLKEEVLKLIDANESKTSFQDVDKFHRNGRRKGSEQDVIIRFKSHSAKEDFYKKRKTIKIRGVKVQPSLSLEKKKMLEAAKEQVNDYFGENGVAHLYANPPDFVLADVHGNLLLKFKAATKDGLFIRFDSLPSLHDIIKKYNENEDFHHEAVIDFDREMGAFD